METKSQGSQEKQQRQDRRMGAGAERPKTRQSDGSWPQSLGLKKGRGGKKGAGFSEVKAEVGTESSEGVPDRSQSRWWGVSSARRGALPTHTAGRGRVQRAIMQAPRRYLQPGPTFPTRKNPDRPLWASHPPPSPFTSLASFTLLYTVGSAFSEMMPNLAALQPGPASSSAEAPPSDQ